MTAIEIASFALCFALPLVAAICSRGRGALWWFVVALSILISWAIVAGSNILMVAHATAVYDAALRAQVAPPAWADARSDDPGLSIGTMFCGWFPGAIVVSAIETWRRLTRRDDDSRGFEIASIEPRDQ